MTTTYDEFLLAKTEFDSAVGFDIEDDTIHPLLLPHQRAIDWPTISSPA